MNEEREADLANSRFLTEAADRGCTREDETRGHEIDGRRDDERLGVSCRCDCWHHQLDHSDGCDYEEEAAVAQSVLGEERKPVEAGGGSKPASDSIHEERE